MLALPQRQGFDPLGLEEAARQIEPEPTLFDSPWQIGLTVLVAWIAAFLIGRLILVWGVQRISGRTKATWDDLLVENRVPQHLAHAVPFITAFFVAEDYAGENAPEWISLVQRFSLAAIWAVIAWTLHGVLSTIHELYIRRQDERRRPIKGYIQLIRILVSIAGSLLALASLLGQDLGSLLAGIGVSTAIILLVFKDTILALIASVQLTANDMVRVGDWIEMPSMGADGDVIDIALHTVKVRNWDKTITTIPTSELYAKTFKNWRGMQDSGGRRIKRSVRIDLHSVRFLRDDDLERLSQIGVLKAYLADKVKELEEYNRHRGQDEQRRMTNLGTFRAYLARWLRDHPEVNKTMTLLVRQLASTPEGVPIELYLFTNTTAWGEYERIQADIFEHIFSIAPAFDLRVFQNPSGHDVELLAAPRAAAEGD